MQQIHSVGAPVMNNSTTTSDLIASVVTGHNKINANKNNNNIKTNNNNTNINKICNKNVSATATATNKMHTTATKVSGTTNNISLNNNNNNSGNILMSADIVNLANALSSQASTTAPDARAKQVLKEAVDAVVNSFAKHTQGYGRGK